MTITIPILDLFFWLWICTMSALAIYQGWRICFMNDNSLIYLDALFLVIVKFLGYEKRYRDWLSEKYKPKTLKVYGYSVLIGGFMGFCSGAYMFYTAISNIKVWGIN